MKTLTGRNPDGTFSDATEYWPDAESEDARNDLCMDAELASAEISGLRVRLSDIPHMPTVPSAEDMYLRAEAEMQAAM